MPKRILTALLEEIAEEHHWKIASFSDEWLFRIETKEGKVAHIFGYDFPINNACARQIAKDKAATADILSYAGIPCVEHRLFLPPSIDKYVSARGNWKSMLEYAENHAWNIVIKPNVGTGGNGVERVRSPKELERLASVFFASDTSLCLSPFIPILRECRIILLDDEALLAYEKVRPSVVGDGTSTVAELVCRIRFTGDRSELSDFRDLSRVPSKGEVVYLNWRHNLGQGSAARELTQAEADAFLALARCAMRAVGLRFASVDCIETTGDVSVMEINAGVMMEVYARQSASAREKAKEIYRRTLEKHFLKEDKR